MLQKHPFHFVKDFAKTVVKDHCQLTGKFSGMAHIECNLKTQKAHSSHSYQYFSTIFPDMIVI